MKQTRRLLTTALLLVVASLAACGPDEAPAQPETDHQKSLTDQLKDKQEAFARDNPELARVFDQGVRDVAASGVMDTARQQGDAAPDFELTEADGGTVRLSELAKQGPVVLVWYRGGWCPYCVMQLKVYQAELSRIRRAGGQVVAIAPEVREMSARTKGANGLKFPVLSDRGNAVAAAFGLVYRLPEQIAQRFEGRVDLAEYNGDQSLQLPLAVTYIVEPDLTISHAWVSADYRERADPEQVIRALNAR